MNQIEQLKAARQRKNKRIRSRVSQIATADCSGVVVQAENIDVHAIEEICEHLKAKKQKYGNT